jgi:chemotaxis protein MotB
MAGRKAKKHEHVNHERWLVSYADFITLLFAFFVVMFAVSQVDSKKLGRFVESVNFAFQFDGVFSPNQGSPLARGGAAGTSIVPLVVAERPTFLANRAASPRAKAIRESIETDLEEPRIAGQISVRFDPRGVAIALPERVFFYTGTATFRPEAMETLRKVASAVAGQTVPVQIESHTDDLASPSAMFPSNWELSAARAAHLASYLVEESGVAPARLSAAGLAEFHPLVDESNEPSLELNRRVDLVLITGTETE